MPREKDLKRLVRARMKKTGESYTSARSQLLTKSRPKTAVRRTAAPAPAAIDHAALAGMADAAVKEKTGRTWEEWTRALDTHGAGEMTHRDIATIVSGTYKVPDWWSQTVTVGYERIKGLRARGQRRDGTYEAAKSRTYNVPVATLFDAWADAATRRRWLDEAGVKVRTATAPKTMRLGWSDGSVVVVLFTSKSNAKSAVAIQHTKLPDKQASSRFKTFWSERLDALAEVLSKS